MYKLIAIKSRVPLGSVRLGRSSQYCGSRISGGLQRLRSVYEFTAILENSGKEDRCTGMSRVCMERKGLI